MSLSLLPPSFRLRFAHAALSYMAPVAGLAMLWSAVGVLSIECPAAEPAATAGPSAEQTSTDQKGSMSVGQQSFGKTADGTEETLFVCSNRNGCELQLTTYGARLVSLTLPDRNGKLANVALGFDTLDAYETHKSYFGCTTGRYANRIAGGHFKLNGKDYRLALNQPKTSLHGGLVGFDRRHWDGKPIQCDDACGVEFTYRSGDGEEGYPGNLDLRVAYTWSNDNALTIRYTATTDQATVLNLTNHAYWNLGGVVAGKPLNGDILDEELLLEADAYVPTDEDGIPTGELAPVKGTIMDFTSLTTIGERIDALKKPGSPTKGYDFNYVLREQSGNLSLAARVVDPKSGRMMEVLTTEPGMQLYTGNFLNGDRNSGGFNQHDALCLEAQHYPDSPNHADFPTTVLKPGDTYRQTTVHLFSVR